MKTIAVLDDDEIVRELINKLLSGVDFNVLLYESEVALFTNESELEQSDLLLLDIHLKDSNGIEVLKRLKSDTRYNALPVIMITANSSDKVLEECFLNGAADYITKPFKIRSLRSRIQAALDKSQRFRDLEHEIALLTEQSQVIDDANQRYLERINNLEMLHQELSSTTQHLAAATWRERQRKDELNAALEELQLIKGKVEHSRTKILDSINYAKKIQSAFLPTTEAISEMFPSFFVFYQPRDIVSGDFYWCKDLGDQQFIGAFDCTGHGVPGAFMSLIGMSLLNEIVSLKEIHDVEKVLEYLHMGVYTLLNQDTSDNRDGMDAALCCIDTKNKVLRFSGASNPLIYFRDDECHIIRGTKLSIGGNRINGNGAFELEEVPLEGIREFYLFSDGLQDQFGGEEGKKLGMKNVVSLINDIHKEPMEVQKEKIEAFLQEWMTANGSTEKQIDDILFIGVRLDANK